MSDHSLNSSPPLLLSPPPPPPPMGIIAVTPLLCVPFPLRSLLLSTMFAKLFNNCLFGGDQQPSSSSNSADGGGGEKQRVVRANDRAYNAPFKYATNFIKTSKYSLLTFLPRNLYQQFTRIANFYFLVLLCLQFFPQIASVPWMYTLVPLSCVLACSAVKDAFDDLQRHRSDRQVNSRVSYVVRNSRLESEKWMDVRVGDIVRMENGHFIAADLLLLSTSESHGLCYIETAELDGETNLKTRVALAETVPLNDRLRDISEFDGEIICEPPNNRLDHFEGRLEWRGSAIPLDNRNMLLRGCRLRNTRWCYGMVVFAGKDTKLMQNSGHAPTKRTSLDRFLNLLILGIVLFLLAMCLICTMMSGLWEHVTGRHFRVFLPWDEFVVSTKQVLSMPTSFNGISLPASDDEETDQNSVGPSKALIIAALQFFSYMILLNTVVPISLYISVEMIRLAHSKFINNDIKMYDDKTDTPARARTSTLNEELGQCSINGRSYGDVMTERGEILPIDEEKETPPALDFSDNHWHEPHFRFYDRTLVEDTRRGVEEVQINILRKPGKVLEYQAQSPDEAALTSAARNFGFVFKSRTPKSITIEVNGAEEVYEVLHILDFDNVRKRMSVLIRNATRTVLYCKGADTMILDRLSARGTSELLRSATHQHLDKFATDGLRTLCTAYKPVDAEYCSKWVDRLRNAQLDSQRKDELVEALYEEMEQDMLLLGATAIEDKLQDGVPQTIATLAAANIKIWVLTGDKTETAINIGYSCRLLTEEMREVFIIDGKEEKEVEVQLKDTRRRICSAKQTQQIHRMCNQNERNNFYYSQNLALCQITKSKINEKRIDGEKTDGIGDENAVERYIAGQIAALEMAELLDGKGRGQWRGGIWPTDGRQRMAQYMKNNSEEKLEKSHKRCRSAFDEQMRRNRWSINRNIHRTKMGQIVEGKAAVKSQVGTVPREERHKSGAEATKSQERHKSSGDGETTKQRPSVGVSSFYPSPSTPLAPSPSLLESPYSANSPSPPPSNGVAPSVLPIANGATTTTTAFANGTTEGSTKTKNASVHSPRFVSVESPRSTATNGGQMDSGRSRQVTASEAEKGTEEKRKSGGSEAAEDEENGGREGEYALVINGEALAHALKRKYEKTLLEIGANCSSVICCRVTPLQKAQVVDLVKRNVKAVTLAIGDGANDVSMIRTAHIGVGISGQEGMQAVLSSDFSIGQFRFLERLLLVHGRWSYLRMCKFLRYFFYKNFAYTLPHFWYSFFCGFSAQTVYDPVLISMYNLCFTALPVLAMAIFDQDVDEEYSTRFPRLYIPGQFNLFFNMRIFIHSIIHGMISSLVLFFVPFGALFRAVSENGRGLYDYSLFAFTAYTALVGQRKEKRTKNETKIGLSLFVNYFPNFNFSPQIPFSVLVVTGQIAFDTAYWTWINWLVVGGSLAFYVLTVFVCYQVPFSQLVTGTYNFGVAARAVRIPEFWLSLLLICVILLVPVIANRFFWFDTHPSYSDRLRVRHRFCMEPSDKAPTAEAMKQTAPITKTSLAKRSLRSGYAFSHCSGFGELIAKGTLFKNIEHLRIPSFQFALHHDSHSNHRSRRHSLSRVHPALSSANSHSSDQQILNPIVLNSDNDDGEGAAVSSMTHFSPTSSNMTTTTTLGGGNAKSQQKIRPILPPPSAVPNSSRLHQSQHHSHQSRHHKHHQPTSTRRSTIESLVIEQPPSADDEKDDGMTPMITQIAVKEEDEEGDEVIRATELQQRVGRSNYQQGTTPTELIRGSDQYGTPTELIRGSDQYGTPTELIRGSDQYGKMTELVDSTDQHWSSERVEASDHYGKSTADGRPLSERDNESPRMVTAYSARPIDMARPSSELKHNLVVNAELEDEEDQRSEMPTPNTSHSFVVNAELDDDVPSLPSHWLRKADTMLKLFDANELAMASVEQTAAAEHGKTFVSKTRRKSSSSSATSRNSREMGTVKMDSQRNRKRVFTGKKPRQGERQRESEEETTKV
ncbi:hypothetical protein niasHS_000596 [Heterodera schachtii]|uniref:P-type phospholipid transporter n=1 Tax=Heterodera schachtii TaxID=97005 RepID=A0ABD2K4P3_HETSC